MCFSYSKNEYRLLLKRGLIFSGCQNFNSASGWQMLGHYYEWNIMEGCLAAPPGWPGHNLCLLAAQSQWVQMFTSHSHRVSEGSEGWFSRTWGPQIWLCPAVAEGKQSALTFQSENSDKSDVLSCWDCCHTIGRMSTSHIGNVKVFFAAPCSYVTRSLVRHTVTTLCVHSTLTSTSPL